MTEAHGPKELLRFLTAGSVDDGKSTLIGRLLYEADGIYEDQLESVRKASAREDGQVDLALITDGLKAEREQAITIDVAHRYFSTRRRKFIIADAPGHEQYTRNMVTGASTADLAVLLVDARKGVLEQTRRHTYIIWLLRIRTLVVAINKMDLVGFDRSVFEMIRRQVTDFTAFMSDLEIYFVPISALAGDNVVRRSGRTAWYQGPALLELLEEVSIGEDRNLTDFRFPVQGVVRPDQDVRGYWGRIASGAVRHGQEALALPSERRITIERISLHQQVLTEAYSPQSVLLFLADSIDLGRGDMLVAPDRIPTVSTRLFAKLIWMCPTPLVLNHPYLIKHTSQILCGRVVRLFHRIDVHTFDSVDADTLRLNEIGKVELQLHKPVFADAYACNRTTGSFIVIDPKNNDTVGAGMIEEPGSAFPEPSTAGLVAREPAGEGAGLVVWFTGLSGSGKTTISTAVHTELLAGGFRAEMLDGDVIREQLNRDLGFSRSDRDENIRRIGFVAQLLARHGVIVLVSAISPYRASRDQIRRSTPHFLEVFVNAPLAVCEERDPKGMYRRARAKEIAHFTAIDDPYEPPLAPDIQCNTDQESVRTSTDRVFSAVAQFLAARR